MKDLLLKVRHLNIKFKLEQGIFPVVDDLNFDLESGKTLAIVGESGCGKSITAFSLMGLLPRPPSLPAEGEVLFQGHNLLRCTEKQMRKIRGKEISMIFQDPMSSFNPVYSIGAQLIESVWTHLRLAGESAAALAIKALEDVHLPRPKEVMTLFPHQLSGGMLQRAMIAMALICSPQILIADEPTTALDVTIQRQILALLKELQDKKGMATLLITHDMGVVAENADEVIVMYAGKQVERGSVFSLFDAPAHPYTQALFASRPHSATAKKKLAAIPGFVPRLNHLPGGCSFHPRCRYTMPLCRLGKVPTFPLKEKGHETRCWLYDKELEPKLVHEETS